jgi:L-threonylcarbamoyladenylate synthase
MDTAVTNIRKADAAAIEAAAAILRAGGLVAFPTETVYGLGADAGNDNAVASIFEAKGRPRFNPLIVHVPNAETAETLVEFLSLSRGLARAFWPGALTLVLPRKPRAKVSLLVSAGLDTVAVRVPSHPLARRLLGAARLPIAAPSANASGQISPTTAAHVLESLGNKVDLILDGGAAMQGIESTVIGFENGRPVMLRPGAIPREDIERVAGPLASAADETISSPGQLPSHYAPRAKLRLDAQDVQAHEIMLAFGPNAPSAAKLNLSPSGDLKEAAANLFAMLRKLDATGARTIAVMPIPDNGLGEAINDRLRRAAAPREMP